MRSAFGVDHGEISKTRLANGDWVRASDMTTGAIRSLRRSKQNDFSERLAGGRVRSDSPEAGKKTLDPYRGKTAARANTSTRAKEKRRSWRAQEGLKQSPVKRPLYADSRFPSNKPTNAGMLKVRHVGYPGTRNPYLP